MFNNDELNLKHFIEFRGISQEVRRFNKLLEISKPQEHILIKGPRGAGKSYFINLFTKHYPEQNKPYQVNCAAIHPTLMASELFGHVKGAFTGATKDQIGIIETAEKNKQPLLLEEFNSLAREHQAQILVFMETGNFLPVGGRKLKNAKVRIIATMNYEEDTTTRLDILDRFKIIIEVPPLHKRRNDIFTFIAKSYNDIKLTTVELLALYSYNWPGNIRELDQVLYEMKAGLGIGINKLFPFYEFIEKIYILFIKSGLKDEDISNINDRLFCGIIPFNHIIADNNEKYITEYITFKFAVDGNLYAYINDYNS